MSVTTHGQQAADSILVASQPPIVAVAGATYFGMSVDEWILLGTAALLGLNLVIATHRVFTIFRYWGDKHEQPE